VPLNFFLWLGSGVERRRRRCGVLNPDGRIDPLLTAAESYGVSKFYSKGKYFKDEVEKVRVSKSSIE